MIRVVLDTNILISALLQARGLPARTFLLALAGTTAQLCVSGDIYAEYEEVIRRPKFNRGEAIVEQALRAIRQNGFWIRPTEKVRACSDPDDDIFLECAQAARAHYLVTGNVRDFPAKWADTQIVTARQFLDAVAESQGEPKDRL
jgi:putative PIN family toxin of toxin-antitoxin system